MEGKLGEESWESEMVGRHASLLRTETRGVGNSRMKMMAWVARKEKGKG